MSNKVTLTQLIAQFLRRQHFRVILNVPGWGGTEVFQTMQSDDQLPAPRLCFNEEAALSLATGASLYGARSALLIKAHGLLKAANALTSTLSTGVRAGQLIFVFDDVHGKSSDNILKIKPVMQSLEAPVIEVGLENPEEHLQQALKLSEKLELPVLIYVNCEHLDQEVPQSNLKTNDFFSPRPWQKNPFRYSAAPLVTAFQRSIFEAKLSGADWNDLPLPSMPNVGAILPPKLKTTYDSYKPFFECFQKLPKDFVAGDAGTSSLFAFPPYQCVDATTYMGGSPGMAAGAYLAGGKRAWSVTGDFSFFAAGILGLNEAVAQSIPIKLVIFSNGKAAATGGQTVPPVMLEKFKREYADLITEISLTCPPKQLTATLERLHESNKLEILINQVLA